MKMIAEENCGAIIYQQQERRGIGIINKIRALTSCGLEIVDRVPLAIKFHSALRGYLKTKREKNQFYFCMYNLSHSSRFPNDLL